MSKVSDERTKLLAANLDRASTACLVLGVFTPFSVGAERTLGGTITWIVIAVVLHLVARWSLKGLTE